ncbi:MAG: aminotransferase class I/II-fold pyridoxal phosphate-dependent enzyme, partial [Dehalococcoidia bacterium]
AKGYLVEALRERGFLLHEGAANFMLVQVADASIVRADLLRQGIAVRDCTSFGLPEFIRIGIRGLQDCRRLVAVLAPLRLPAAVSAEG